MYSFGIVLFEAYSRKEPYEGEDFHEVIRLVMDKGINKRPPIPENCPAQMASIMRDCIVADPTERPTFEELDKRLRRIDPNEALPIRDSNVKQVSLYDIFPKKVAEALKHGQKVEPEHRDVVTIFFSGTYVGFI